MVSPDQFWTAHDDARLTEMVDGKMIMSDISLALGRSRSAVAGRMRRLGLTSKSGRTFGGRMKDGSKPAAKRKQGPVTVNALVSIRGRRQAPGHVEQEAYDPTRPVVKLEDLNRMHCRFPIGDPRGDGFGFCGHTKLLGYPYCSEHCRLAYQGFEAVAA